MLQTAYVKSSAVAEGFDEVLVPGELEFRSVSRRRKDGIPLADTTWEQIVETAEQLNVSL